VAIDVNSGRTSKDSDFEESIFLANMEAASELARQLRLRDLGGLIVVDFIDMRSKRHIREVEKQVKQSMKRDKAKVDISTISRFGLMQISRQKMGAPIEKGSYRTCEYCNGRGVVKTVETRALFYLRRIQTGVGRKNVKRVECTLPVDVAQYLLNNKREELAELEKRHQVNIDILLNPDMKPGENKIEFLES
jgi:ribonuclease E